MNEEIEIETNDTFGNLELYKEYCFGADDIDNIPTFSEFLAIMNE